MITFLSYLPWLLAVGIVLYIIVAGVAAIWCAHEEAKQEAERARFEKMIAASAPPRDWPAKKTGFTRSRRM